MAKVDFSKMTREEASDYVRKREARINKVDNIFIYRVGPVIIAIALVLFIIAHVIPAFMRP